MDDPILGAEYTVYVPHRGTEVLLQAPWEATRDSGWQIACSSIPIFDKHSHGVVNKIYFSNYLSYVLLLKFHT